jgi:hypothetical protein
LTNVGHSTAWWSRPLSMPSRLHKAACPLRNSSQSHIGKAHKPIGTGRTVGTIGVCAAAGLRQSGHVLRASAWVRTEILSLSKGLAGLQTVHPLPHRDRKRHRFSASTPIVRFALLLPPSGEARHLPGARYRLWPPTAPPSVEKQPDATLKADASAFFTRVDGPCVATPQNRQCEWPQCRVLERQTCSRAGATRDFAAGARPEKDLSDR